jgi:hypothetical protein
MPTFRDILLQVSGDASDAERTLTVLSAELDALAAKTIGIKIELTGEDRFLADLAAVEELAALASKEIEIPVKLDRSTFQNELRAMAAEAQQTLARAAPDGGGDRQRGPRTGMFAAIPAATVGVTEEVGRGMEDAAQSTESFVRTVDRGRDGIVGFGFNLAGLVNTLQLLGLVVLAVTAPALAALAASLVGAAAAVGGMLAALGGLLGPVGLVAVGVFTGLAKALQAVSAVRQERQLGQTALGHQAAANAALSHTRAVQQLAVAQRDAARAIRDAAHGVDISQRNQADAARNVQDQTVAAYRAWEDAVDGVGDAMRGLEHAQLDVQRAKLDHESAVLALRELRKELGLTSSEFDSMFNQITDVRLDPGKVAALMPQVDALGLSAEDAIKFKNAILDVADSSLKVRDATDSVKDSSRSFNRAQEERNRFARDGIMAFGPLRGAVEGLADAQWAAARATEHYNDVSRLGVSGAPGVVAAGDALRSASQQVSASADKVKAALESVPPSFRPIIADLDKLLTTFNSVMAAPRRAATAALRPLISGLTGMLEQFRGPIEALGERIGRDLSGLFGGLTGQRSKNFFRDMFADAGPVIDDMVRALGSFAGLLSNIAEAGMGPLQSAAEAVADTLGTWDEKTKPGSDGAQKMTDIFDEGLTVLGKWLTLLGAVGELVIDFFDTTSGKSGGMLDDITALVNKWDEWVTDPENQGQINDAIDTAWETLKDVVKIVGDLVDLFVEMTPIATDLFEGVKDLLDPWLSLISDVLDQTNKLPAPLRDISGILAALVAVGGPLALFKGGISLVREAIGRLGLAVISRFGSGGRISNILSTFFERIRPSWRRGARTAAEEAVGDASGSAGIFRRGGRRLAGFFQNAYLGYLEGSGAGGGFGGRLGALMRRAVGGVGAAARFLGRTAAGQFVVSMAARVAATIVPRLVAVLGAESLTAAAMVSIGAVLGLVIGTALVGALIGTLLNKIPFIRHTAQRIAADALGFSQHAEDTTESSFEKYTQHVLELQNRIRRARRRGDAPTVNRVTRELRRYTRALGNNFAQGGVIRGFGGGDIVPAWLEPGEGILRKEVVANLGAATINALNASYPSVASTRGGYVNGGLVDTGTQRAVEQHFHIPPAAPANPQPDPEITAAQLSMHMRVQGMRL